MADLHKYQAHEILNKVLNSAETGLQVDIVSGAEYAEDSAHTSADTGNFVLGVRNDTLAALGGTDGDYVPFQMNASGALFVEVATLPAPAVQPVSKTPLTAAPVQPLALEPVNSPLVNNSDLSPAINQYILSFSLSVTEPTHLGLFIFVDMVD